MTSHVRNDVTPDGEYKDSEREEFHKKFDAIFSEKRGCYIHLLKEYRIPFKLNWRTSQLKLYW